MIKHPFIIALILTGLVLTFITLHREKPTVRPVEPPLYGAAHESSSLIMPGDRNNTAHPYAFTAFNEWVDRWASAKYPERAALESEGIRLALARREALRALLRADPGLAEKWAIPYARRSRLPASVQAILETAAISAS